MAAERRGALTPERGPAFHLAMRSPSCVVAALGLTLGLAGCGDDTGSGGSAGSTTTTASGTTQAGTTSTQASTSTTVASTSTGVGGLIPDPGNGMNGEWTDIEPNDLPSQAVPMGILSGPIWAGFVMPYTAINPATDVDYFVFKTGADLSGIYMALCWSFAGDLLDMYLYQVDSQMQGAMVASAATTGSGCETLVDFGMGATVLAPDTTYLLEVRGAPGLDLAGDPGLYSA